MCCLNAMSDVATKGNTGEVQESEPYSLTHPGCGRHGTLHRSRQGVPRGARVTEGSDEGKMPVRACIKASVG